jgi:cytochrome P450
MDSTIRESLRTNPTLVRGLLRGAVHKDGLDLPDGSHIPSGSWVGTPVLNIHTDSRFYEKAEEFDPWRFVDRDVKDSGKKKEEHIGPFGQLKIESGQVNDTFLSFGGGKHAW